MEQAMQREADKPTRGGSRWLGLVLAGVGLYWLWSGTLGSDARGLEDVAPTLSSVEAVEAFPVGEPFWLEGRVAPAAGSVAETWKNYFAFRKAAGEKDYWGSWKVVVSEEVRPELIFTWSGGRLVAPADSYDLSEAPQAPDEGVMSVSQRNTGFRPGEEAVAIVTKDAAGTMTVTALAAGPATALAQERAETRRARGFVSAALRVAASFLLLIIGLRSLLPRRRSEA